MSSCVLVLVLTLAAVCRGWARGGDHGSDSERSERMQHTRVGMPSAVWTVEMATGLRNISQCLEKVPTKSSPY